MIKYLNDCRVDAFVGSGFSQREPPCLVPEEFSSGVRVPSGSWSPVPVATASDTGAIDCRFDGATIFVVSLAPEILNDAYRLLSDSLHPSVEFPEISRTLNSVDCSLLTRKIESSIRTYFVKYDLVISEPVVACSFLHLSEEENGINDKSTTQDVSTNCGLRGMHVDNWQLPPIAPMHRTMAAYKLLVNMGTTKRGFSFVDFPISTFARELQELTEPLDPYLKWAVEQPYATPLAEYLLSNPGLLRPNLIQYPPGTALLAPVQNLIHDGYPEGMNDADFCLQARIHVEVN